MLWKLHPEVTLHFARLSYPNPSLHHVEAAMPAIEIFVNHMYKVNDEIIKTNDEARYHLAATKSLDFDHLMPTSDATKMHVMRATFQAGYIWANCLKKNCPDMAILSDWGFQRFGEAWIPLFTTLPILSAGTCLNYTTIFEKVSNSTYYSSTKILRHFIAI